MSVKGGSAEAEKLERGERREERGQCDRHNTVGFLSKRLCFGFPKFIMREMAEQLMWLVCFLLIVF